jgi:hypothetical protein
MSALLVVMRSLTNEKPRCDPESLGNLQIALAAALDPARTGTGLAPILGIILSQLGAERTNSPVLELANRCCALAEHGPRLLDA